ncbi:kinase-like domain-containing protein [Aspergillus varians]
MYPLPSDLRPEISSSRKSSRINLFKVLPAAKLVEEEHTPRYKPEHFYPVRLYEVLNNRYQIAAKIGWGTSSTVRLARDSHQSPHLTLTDGDGYHPVTKLLLEGLRYLHGECHIIHTDLKSDNIMLALLNPSVLDSVAQDEMSDPSPRKEAGDRTIYLPRNHWGLKDEDLGRAVIADFGLSVGGDRAPNSHPIQPDGYRAPEVCLGAEWSCPVDVWNLAVMHTNPFNKLLELCLGRGPSEEAYLGQIISLLGLRPQDLLARGKETSRYFDNRGQFKFPDLVGQITLAFMASGIDDDAKPLFLEFISRMLCWRPEDRATVDELLKDPWLQ